MKFTANWLPGGSCELGPIPIKGELELRKMDETTATLRALWHNENSLKFGLALLAADKVRLNLGDKSAKESWDEYMLLVMAPRGVPTKDLIWPEGDFAKNLEANRQRIFRSLQVKDNEEAEKKLDQFAEKLTEEAKTIKSEDIDILNRKPLISLYWQLRTAGVKKFLMPTGPVDVPWNKDCKIDQPLVLDLLSEIVTKEQLESLSPKDETRVIDMKELEPTTVAEVQGKSSPEWKASTESSPTSEPSSAKVSFSVTSEVTPIPS
jgi:hypothetical protein